MTNDQLEAIWKANIDKSRMTAMRAVWNAGYYEGAGVTPTASSPDKSVSVSKPAAIVKPPHCGD